MTIYGSLSLTHIAFQWEEFGISIRDLPPTLLAEVNSEPEKCGKALIVDCHSFPGRPLPCDSNQSAPRADFRIGTDSFRHAGGISPVSPSEAPGGGVQCKDQRSLRGSVGAHRTLQERSPSSVNHDRGQSRSVYGRVHRRKDQQI